MVVRYMVVQYTVVRYMVVLYTLLGLSASDTSPPAPEKMVSFVFEFNILSHWIQPTRPRIPSSPEGKYRRHYNPTGQRPNRSPHTGEITKPASSNTLRSWPINGLRQELNEVGKELLKSYATNTSSRKEERGCGDTDTWGTLQIRIWFVRQTGIPHRWSHTYPWNKQTDFILNPICLMSHSARYIIDNFLCPLFRSSKIIKR